MLACILALLNARQEPKTGNMQLGAFVRDVYYPFSRRKWKRSTRTTTEQRINLYILPEMAESALRGIAEVCYRTCWTVTRVASERQVEASTG